MIYIYAMNLNVDGVINPNLSLVQDIPAVHGMHLMNPNLKLGIESSGSFDFTVQPDDYFYDMFAQLKTIIRIDIDDENLFFGRVLTVENGFFGERKIACEGAISFLLDTYYPPVVEKNRTPISIYDYLMKVLDNHNVQCENDQTKMFNAGEIPGQYSANIHEDQKISNEEYAFGASNWTQTKSVLDDLKSHYGGCWRTRFVNNNLYLDWLDQYFSDQINAQKIEIGKNLITASESTEVDNIFTRVIAVGKNDNKDIYLTGYSPSTITGESWTFTGNYFDVSDLTKVYTDQELSTGYHDVSDYRDSKNRYGLIWKIVSFDEANTQDKLFTAATKWVKDNYHGTIEKIQVTAIDMNFIGEDVSKIHVGDRVWLRFPYGKGTNPPIVERLLTCLEINYDLYNPENTSFSFGIPSMALTKNQRSSGKSTKQKASTPAPYPGNDTNNPENDFDEWLGGVKDWMKKNQVWYKHNIVSGKPKQGGPSQIIDSSGKSHKPYFWIYDIEMGDDGKSKVWLWQPNIEDVFHNGKQVKWDTDSQGRTRGHWVKIKGSEFTYDLINRSYLLNYIQYEYGINLQTDLSVKMPAVVADEAGNIDIFSNLFGSDGQGDTLLGKVVSFIADKTGLKADVLNIFNSDGLNVAKLLMEDGTYKFAAIDENGDIITDDDGNVIFLDNRQIHHATQELAYTLEQMGVTVTLLDDQVTIIGQKVGDDTFGLVYDLAKMGIAVTTLTSEVNIIGDVVGDNTTGLVYDLAKMGVSVNALGNDVNIIGNKVGDETRGLVYDLAKMGITVSTLSNDVNIIGNVVGDNTTGLVYDLAKMGISVNALGNDVNIIGNKVGDNTRGLIYDLAKMGISVSALSSDVNIIGDKVGDDTKGIIYDLAKQGLSVTTLTDDVTVVQGELRGAKARISSLETDYLKTDELEGHIAELSVIRAKAITISQSYGYIMSPTYYIGTQGDAKSFDNVIVSASVDTNTNTLTLTPLFGDPITFSKAASTTKVRGSWSGGILTVSADDNGENTYQRSFAVGTVDWQADKKAAYVYGNVIKTSGGSTYVDEADAFSLYVPTTESYNAGKLSVTVTGPTWSSTGSSTGQSNSVSVSKDGATENTQYTYMYIDTSANKAYMRYNSSASAVQTGGTIVGSVGLPTVTVTGPSWSSTGSSTGQSNSVSVSKDGTVQNTQYTYMYVDTSASKAYIRYASSASAAQTGGTIIGSVSIPSVTVTGPTWSSTGSSTGQSNSVSVSKDGTVQNTQYTYMYVDTSSNKAYMRYNSSASAAQTGGTIVGSVSLPTVNVVQGAWTIMDIGESGRASCTFSPSSGSGSSVTQYIGLGTQNGDDNGYFESYALAANVATGSPYTRVKIASYQMSLGSWSSGTNTVTLKNSNGTTVATLPVTAPTVTPTLSGSWSSGTLTVSSSPSAQANYVRSLSKGGVSWSNNIATIPINAKFGNSGQYSESTGWSVTVDASGRYDAGVSAGKTAAGISTSWGTGSGANVLTVSRALSSSTKSATFTVTAGNPTYSYNSSTHKYSLTGTALVNNSQKASGVSSTGTEAYEDGKTDGANSAGNSAWFHYASGAGSNHQGTLNANSYVSIGYVNAAGTTVWKDDTTWLTPAGAGPSYTSRTFRCQSKEQTYPGSTTYKFTFTLEGNYGFTTGTNYSFYRTSWP